MKYILAVMWIICFLLVWQTGYAVNAQRTYSALGKCYANISGFHGPSGAMPGIETTCNNYLVEEVPTSNPGVDPSAEICSDWSYGPDNINGNVDWHVKWIYKDISITEGCGEPFDMFITLSCPDGGILDSHWPMSCMIKYKCGNGQVPDSNGNCTTPANDAGDCHCHGEGEPINPNSGNEYEEVTDYRSNSPFPLEFSRSYNSVIANLSAAYDGSGEALGVGWTTNYGAHLYTEKTQFPPNEQVTIGPCIDPDTEIAYFCPPGGWANLPYYTQATVWHADGSQTKFLYSSSGPGTPTPGTQFANEQGSDGQLFYATLPTPSTDTGYKYVRDDGYTEYYDGNGLLVSVVNRNGLIHNYNYNTSSQLISVADTFGHQLAFTYDSAGHIATMTVPDGGVYTYSYDAKGNLISVQYPDNAVVQYLYTNSGYPHAMTGLIDANGDQYAAWTYDSHGRAVSSHLAGNNDAVSIVYNSDGSADTTEATGLVRHLEYTTINNKDLLISASEPCTDCGDTTSQAINYDSNGFVSSTTDFDGNVTNYTHDTSGLELSRTEAVGMSVERTITTQWNTTLRKPTLITEPGKTTAYTYDSAGRMLSKTVTDTVTNISRTMVYTYNGSGLLASVTDPLGHVTGFAYDAEGNLASITNALGQVTQISKYDANGYPLTIIDPNGVETDLVYDARQRLISRTVAGATTSFGYDAVGNLLKVTLPTGAYLQYSYDAAHRLTGIADNLGNTITYTLDSLGNRTGTQTKDPSGTVTRTLQRVYNNLNQLQKLIGGAGQTTTYTDDLLGNQTAITDPMGHVTSQTFDALNRLTSIIDPANGTTKYGYDSQDHVTDVTDPRSLHTGYTYDGFGDVTQTNSPDTGVTTYTYDADGNRLSQTGARGITTQYTYDALNRLTGIEYPDSSENVTYSYDQGQYGIGHLTGMTDASGSTRYQYDAHGDVTHKTVAIVGNTATLAYQYDAADELTCITYPDGTQVAYQRDAAERVTAVTETANGHTQTLASGISYEPFGPVASFTYGNGLVYTRSYDQDYRLTSEVAGNLQNLSYSYNPNDDITAITDGITAANSQSFGYDTLDRLTSATGGYGTLGYGYDADGNRLTATHDSDTDTYDYDSASNRLQSVTGSTSAAFQYTANGDTTNDGTFSYTFNQANRLSTVQQNSALIAQYQYNALGQRVAKTAGSNSDQFIYDEQGQLLAELGANGTPVKEYIYLGNLPLGQIATTTYSTSGGTTTTLDTDSATITGTWPASTSVGGYLGSNYLDHAPTDDTPLTVIADDGSVRFSVVGDWLSSTAVAGYQGADYLYHTPNGPSPDAQVIDDTDAGFSTVGTWTSSTAISGFDGSDYVYHAANGTSPDATIEDAGNPGVTLNGTWNASTSVGGYYGANYLDHAAGTGANSVVYPLTASTAGQYTIYARWTANPNRASNATYVIHTAAGDQSITVDQQSNGGQWNALATVTLDPASPGSVTLSDNANGYVIADAIEIVPQNARPNQATWYFTVPASGSYQVYARWSAYSNRATNAQYTVQAADGAHTATENQQSGGGQWNLLGTFSFDSSGSVTLTDQANGYVIADAIEVVPQNARSNSATWTLAPLVNGPHKVYARWTASSNRATNAQYTVNYGTGIETVNEDQQTNGGQWVLLGTYTLNTSTPITVTLTDQADGDVIADAVKIVPDPDPSIENVTWPLDVTTPGKYNIYARWTANPNRTKQAGYVIDADDGSHAVTENQQTNGGQWNLLGNFSLSPTGSNQIELDAAEDGYTIADGIQLVPTSLQSTSSNLYYYLTDQLGTPTALVDQAGNIVWQATKMPFGETTVFTDTVSNNLRFPGQYYDAETGHNYNYFRDYDSTTGRYIESDPTGLFGGVNTYSYVNGNPIINMDFYGLCWIYSQSTGIMKHTDINGNVDAIIGGGYAGYGAGLNNPAMQYVKGTRPNPSGPLPQNQYHIGKIGLHIVDNGGVRLPDSMRLTPVYEKYMHNRGGFLFHGSNDYSKKLSSEGCPVNKPKVRKLVAWSQDQCFLVVP